jgi:two-component system, NtrC family, response regulator AtoC
VVLLDINMPDINGLQLLPDLLKASPQVAVVMITGQASHKSAVSAMKLGAEDYLEKPFHMEELELVLARFEEKLVLRHEVAALKRQRIDELSKDYLVLNDPAMVKIYRALEEVGAKSQVAVLIEGETGTGKEHAARLLHLFSPRAAGPFVELHCAALPEGLLESELFGYEAGAFTDAKKQKRGLFEAAQGGTLFLDEVGELPVATQTKLLKVLEDRTMRRLGGIETIRLDVRVVSATNRRLSEEIAAGRFRPDLYYRLNVFSVKLPPLRDRPSDLDVLAQHFFRQACADFENHLQPLSDDAIAALHQHGWPGNVRELKNFMERLVLSALGGSVDAKEVRQALPAAAARAGQHSRVDRDSIAQALKDCGGDKSRAAQLLGISRPTLYRHLKAYKL